MEELKINNIVYVTKGDKHLCNSADPRYTAQVGKIKFIDDYYFFYITFDGYHLVTFYKEELIKIG